MPSAELPPSPVDDPWWVISETSLLMALRKVATGTDPDIVMMELEANSETRRLEGE